MMVMLAELGQGQVNLGKRAFGFQVPVFWQDRRRSQEAIQDVPVRPLLPRHQIDLNTTPLFLPIRNDKQAYKLTNKGLDNLAKRFGSVTPNIEIIGPDDFFAQYAFAVGRDRRDYFRKKERWDVPLLPMAGEGYDLDVVREAQSVHTIITEGEGVGAVVLGSMRTIFQSEAYDSIEETVANLPFLATQELNSSTEEGGVKQALVEYASQNSRFEQGLRENKIASMERLTPGRTIYDEGDPTNNTIESTMSSLLLITALCLNTTRELEKTGHDFVVFQANQQMKDLFMSVFNIPETDLICKNIFQLEDGTDDPCYTLVLDIQRIKQTALPHLQEYYNNLS